MDPLYRQILAALAGHLDPKTFEDCACDLLRDSFPSLVPVRGGSDAGMDGAIADCSREAFPLIVTTREDFPRNLRESLKSFLAHGRRPRKAVFATSREITPPQRRRLEDDARDLGFTLVQIVDRHGMTQRLYRSPQWLQGLLHLSAEPFALSAVPLSRRPSFGIETVGRQAELETLRSTQGDLVVAGQPGAGKTFLLQQRIREGWNALFLVDEDRGEVKRALLELRPEAVIVDDAHVREGVLPMLRHLRQETGLSFALVATTWTWEEDRETVTGNLPGASLLELPPLPRHQILEVFQRLGVRESDEVLRELVDQARNRPGLAATIADLWKRGEWKTVFDGRVLHREVLAAFGQQGEEVEDVLAAFSLGGDRGLGLEPVQRFLHLDRPALRRRTAALAAGGVLEQGADGALSVWPRRLRTSLLRTVFFSTPQAATSDDLQALLDETPGAEAVEELAAVRQAGAGVPPVRDLVLRADFTLEAAQRAWQRLALASDEEARWVLGQFLWPAARSGAAADEVRESSLTDQRLTGTTPERPGASPPVAKHPATRDLLAVASALLERIPGEVIPPLLERAAEERPPGRESQAMNLLARWVQSPDPVRATEEALRRRELLALAARQFLVKKKDAATGIEAIFLALTPNQKGSSRDPGLGSTIRSWSMFLPLEALRKLRRLWQELKAAVPTPERAGWQHIATAVWSLQVPESLAFGMPVPEDVRRELLDFAHTLLADLIPLARERAGLRAGVARLSAKLPPGASLALDLDPVFERFYPESYVESDPERESVRQEALRELAGEWSLLGPQEGSRRLAHYEAEADLIGYGWPRGTHTLCVRLAELVDNPRDWLEATEANQLASPLAVPFLERILADRGHGWEQVAEHRLEMDSSWTEAVGAILAQPEAPATLVRRALDRAAGRPDLVKRSALRREMPVTNLLAALEHPRWEVALAAAVGEWCASQQKGVRPELQASWQAAILKARVDGSRTGSEYWLAEILGRDSELALAWLLERLCDQEWEGSPLSGPLASALGAIDRGQRAEVLEALPASPISEQILPRLVGEDVELYRRLLELAPLAPYHLAPLAGKPSPPWIELALQALAAGHSPEEVAEAAVFGPWGHHWVGSGEDYAQEWVQAFTALEAHPHPGINQAARHGKRVVNDVMLKPVLARRRRFELQGM